MRMSQGSLLTTLAGLVTDRFQSPRIPGVPLLLVGQPGQSVAFPTKEALDKPKSMAHMPCQRLEVSRKPKPNGATIERIERLLPTYSAANIEDPMRSIDRGKGKPVLEGELAKLILESCKSRGPSARTASKSRTKTVAGDLCLLCRSSSS